MQTKRHEVADTKEEEMKFVEGWWGHSHILLTVTDISYFFSDVEWVTSASFFPHIHFCVRMGSLAAALYLMIMTFITDLLATISDHFSITSHWSDIDYILAYETDEEQCVVKNRDFEEDKIVHPQSKFTAHCMFEFYHWCWIANELHRIHQISLDP